MKSRFPLGKLGAGFRCAQQDDRPQDGQSEPRPQGSGQMTIFNKLLDWER